MVAGQPGIDFPQEAAALSILPLGRDHALTSRVRRVGETRLAISNPRKGSGEPAPFIDRDLLELSWQAEDGLRSVPATLTGYTDTGEWQVRITGPANRIQRREAVRAPIGLSVMASFGRVVLTGSTADLSEGGARCVFRPHRDLGTHIPFPKRGTPVVLQLDLYSDVLSAEAVLVHRFPRDDQLLEWSVRFVALSKQSQDLIRSHVFTALRNARARGLSRLY